MADSIGKILRKIDTSLQTTSVSICRVVCINKDKNSYVKSYHEWEHTTVHNDRPMIIT